jgi:mannan endo-1,4-beta-mannosidase
MNVRRTKRHALLAAVLAALLASAFSAAHAQSPSAAPVNPNATPQARALLRYIDSISGHSTLTGQHNYPNTLSRYSDRVYDLTGKYPALFGQDFGFSGGEDKDSVEGRPAMIEEIKRQYQNGAVIALTWHAVRPTEDEPVTFHDSVQGHLTDFEWSELLTPGSDLNKRWCVQVDIIAGYLRQLSDAGVPVLMRPYHEMNGNWFWWGGRPGSNGSAALYRLFFDRMVNVHKLNNLVWVWNVNSPSPNAGPLSEYYPGPQYVDLLTMDIYGEFKPSYYTDMLALAADKPIALGEVGGLPSPEVIAQQPRWAYFMDWSELAEALNTPEQLQAVYHAPSLITRDDPAFTRSMAEIRASAPGTRPAVEPVSSGASPEARALLASLYAASGKSTLSGQQNDAHAPTAATDAVITATGKHPAIWSADLAVPAGATEAATRQAIIDEAKRQGLQHSIVSLGWLPARPTDGQAGTLTDFEWKQLLTPGTQLNQRWTAQVDSVAGSLKQLQDAGVAVLWSPYAEPNNKKNWWAGRKGVDGYAALYRMLFDRLVTHNGLHNLVWVWEAAPPGFGPNANGPWNDYFPGLLYVDALSLNLSQPGSRYRIDTGLKLLGNGKVIGLYLSGPAPDPALFTQEPDWSWFVLDPSGATSPGIRKLYEDSRITSRNP